MVLPCLCKTGWKNWSQKKLQSNRHVLLGGEKKYQKFDYRTIIRRLSVLHEMCILHTNFCFIGNSWLSLNYSYFFVTTWISIPTNLVCSTSPEYHFCTSADLTQLYWKRIQIKAGSCTLEMVFRSQMEIQVLDNKVCTQLIRIYFALSVDDVTISFFQLINCFEF